MSKPEERDRAAFEVGKVIDGRYKVVRLIGQGGNGLVHEVEHVLSGRRLALKSLLEEAAVGRLEQEARAAALMRNRHAVMITDMGQSPEIGPYLVMELLEGQSLRALIEEAGQLPLETSVNIALQVCECLDEAHQQGLVHRDLKPDNVYLCAGYGGQVDVKVLDFGVVKVAGGGPIPNSSLTRTGSTVGTPFYMSLEQLRNSSNVDARSDIYALSVVLYEALSGQKPFQAETIGDLVYALCSGPPTPLDRLRPDLPKPVVDIVMRGLSSNRDERPASMHELAAALAPHGDPAFGLWLRTSTGAKGAAPGAAEPHSAAAAPATPAPPPPSGAIPKPPRPVLGRAPATGAPRPVEPAAAPAPPAVTPAPAPEPPTHPITAPPPPPLAEPPKPAPRPPLTRPELPAPSGDRDTPTEMYVKDVHGAGPPAPQPPPPPRGEPPRALEGQRDTPTEAIEGFQEKLHASIAHEQGMPPLTGSGDTAALPAVSEDPELSTRRLPPGTIPMVPESTTTVAMGKPSWQVAVESAGMTVERWAISGANAFRAASPREQLVVVVIGASIVGVLVVLLLYGLFASSAPPSP